MSAPDIQALKDMYNWRPRNPIALHCGSEAVMRMPRYEPADTGWLINGCAATLGEVVDQSDPDCHERIFDLHRAGIGYLRDEWDSDKSPDVWDALGQLRAELAEVTG